MVVSSASGLSHLLSSVSSSYFLSGQGKASGFLFLLDTAPVPVLQVSGVESRICSSSDSQDGILHWSAFGSSQTGALWSPI